MKYLWFAVFLLSLLAGLHKTYNFGWKQSYLFYIFALIAFLMFLLRNYMDKQRKNK